MAHSSPRPRSFDPGIEIAQFRTKEIRFGIIARWKDGLSPEGSSVKMDVITQWSDWKQEASSRL